jgi:hypothetical protein
MLDHDQIVVYDLHSLHASLSSLPDTLHLIGLNPNTSDSTGSIGLNVPAIGHH